VGVRQVAPDFTASAVVDNQIVDNWNLHKHIEGKYAVLFFYPKDFTFVCPTEIIAFSEAAAQFKELNTEVIAVSTDSKFSHFAWIQMPRKQGGLGEMHIPVVSDLTQQISADYGVLIEGAGIAFRGLFIIDDKKKVRQITINDLSVGRSVDEAVRLVQAFKFTDEHGEVCPAGWKPGSKSMKADPKGSLEYFSSAN